MRYPTRIPVAGPWVTDREVAYVAEAARSAWYENAGSFNTRFERAVSEYLGVAHAVSLPHCTAGIHLALAARGIGTGDEVIVPEITWIASSAPVSYVGATPVFADVDPRTWCLSSESFSRSITPRTKAVIAVDVYGGMPAYEELREIAGRHGVFVLEDAAEAFGSVWNGRKAGSWGDAGVFSFHGSKTVTTGEGGMLVTDDRELFERVLFLRDHGRRPGDVFFNNAEVAFKYKMSSFQAAFGLAQVERAEEIVAKKREVFSWYAEELEGTPGLTLNWEPPGMRNSYWMVSAIIDRGIHLPKAELMDLLAERNIDSRPFFNPLSSIPAYTGSAAAQGAPERNPVSYSLSPQAINLPSALSLDREMVGFVCRCLREILDQRRG